MSRFIVKIPGQENQLIEADQLVVNEKARTFDLYRTGAGALPVASVGIGPGVVVLEEAGFVDPHSLR